MKLILKKILLISIVVFHSSALLGCQIRMNEEHNAMNPVGTEDMQEPFVEEEPENVEEDDKVSGMGYEEQNTIREYILYIMNQGEVASTKAVQEIIGQKVELTYTYRKLLEELVDYLGYQIKINEIDIGSDQIKIDLMQASDLFHKEKYDPQKNEPVCYECYDDMAFGLLDSMMMTIRENHGFAIEVLFTEDGKEMLLPGISIEANFPMDEAYQGSKYYIDNYLARSEGSITSIVDLGMSYNDTIIKLKQEEIEYNQTQDFSKLGDQGSWETYDNLNEYLRNAWLHIDLSTDAYHFVFDGPNTELMGITIIKKDLPSSRGLLVGDSFKRLTELYGDAYTMYVIEGSLLYEYQLDDCYFRVGLDATEEYVLNYGIASFSQADIIHGEEIQNEISYREKRLEVN